MKREEEKRIMVVDIDGTISEVGLRRRRLLEQFPVDWDAFYRDNFDDLPKRDVCSFVQFNARRMEVFFCTSRRESVRDKTQKWLLRNLGMQPRDYTLIMRENSDERPEHIQKLDQFFRETTEEERRRVLFVVEDDKTVARMWHRKGFTCFVVR